MPTAKKPPPSVEIHLPKLVIKTIALDIVGDTSLIMNKFSKKAKEQIRLKQEKKATLGREAKNPEADFRGSMYITKSGKYGFPADAFKAAAVDACTSVAGVTKVAARQAFHVVASDRDVEDGRDLVLIDSDKPVMREDPVKIGMGTTDLRYRGEFQNWAARLTIRYNPTMLSPDQIANLINLAGFSVGVGEWRSARDGQYGMFHVRTGADA